ncbi:MAG: 4-demethylwyosine synthase TYW1, partial [Candidatus Heimdallarchaeota archaeon]
APTQLYISIPAPDKREYSRVCKPLVKDGWEKINQSLEIMSKMKGRTVARLTMAKKINMFRAKDYVPLIRKANPSFIEIKGFVPVGFSQYRVTRDNMPYIEDIQAFTNLILEEMPDYEQVFAMPESKVIILSNKKHPLKIPGL